MLDVISRIASMRNLFLASLFGLIFVGSASAADLRYGWDQPPQPAPAYREDDEGYERPRWRDPEWRRPPPPPRVRIEEQEDDEDEPECWTRRTPYGPERVCR